MKVKCEIVVDFKTKNYEITFKDLSGKNLDIDYTELKELMEKVFSDLDQQIKNMGIGSNDQVTKCIH